MQKKNDSSLVKTNTVFFINNFIEYIGKTVLELCLKKSSKKKSSEGTVLSLFVAEMLQRLNKGSLSLEIKNTAEFNRFIYVSYIKSYFLPVAYELASSYEEQLGLLKPSSHGVIRFARYIAECSIIILKQTDKIEVLCSQEQYPLDKIPLKLFVLAAVTKQVKINNHKPLSLISNEEISLSKFMGRIGLRHQIRGGSASDGTHYQYYIPIKKKIEDIIYGSRNVTYNEVIDKGVFLPVKTEGELQAQQSSTIFATLDDINEYLKSFRNNDLEFYDFGIDGFVSYMSNVYFGGNRDITVYCTELDFHDFDMSRANFDGVIFNRCNFNKANLTEASFNGCAIFDSQFQGTLLSATQFNKSKLNFIDLRLAKFGTDNSFANSMMQFANLEGLSLNNANFSCADLTGANHIETDFSRANTISLSSTGSISVLTYLTEPQGAKETISMEKLPFQPYLVRQVSTSHDIVLLMNVLFSDASISRHDNLVKVDSSMLSRLAYGVYATGGSKQLLNVSLYSGDKTNRKNAASFFFDALSTIEKIDLSPQLRSIDKLLNMEHEKFISGISDKSTEQIDEYATVLSQEIFSYDRSQFITLQFYELMQEALNARKKKPSPNFTALQTFSEKLYYRVNQDISGGCSDGGVCLKVFQLYMYTAIKLCTAPYMDLQSASWIIQALSRNSLMHVELSDEDNKLLKELLQYISPFGNFHNLRQLVSKQSIPFLPIITRDILMSMDEAGTQSYLEQMLSIGRIQQELLDQQIHISGIKELSTPRNIHSDFIPTTNMISSDEVGLFLNGRDVDQNVSSSTTNDTKIESPTKKSSARNKRRLSTRELSRFFVRKEEISNDTQVKRDGEEESPSPNPDKLSGGAAL